MKRSSSHSRRPSSGKSGKTQNPLKDTQDLAPAAATDFEVVLQLIESARHRAYQAVNVAMIELYWRIGQHISQKIAKAEWGDGVVHELAAYLAHRQPGQKGFTRRNLFRMRQFFETYQDPEMVSAVLTQLPWTHHLIILGQAKLPEEREFYMRMAVHEKWSSRELERQFRTSLFARVVLSPPQVSARVKQTHPDAAAVFKDSYVFEFLGLPTQHSESDLHRGLLARLRDFITELGSDFCFMGSEVPLQVGARDFALDLLFFHRGMNCLVAVELKVERFEPEHLGKLNFYLEALDRTVKSLTKILPSESCSALPRTARSWNTPSVARSRRH